MALRSRPGVERISAASVSAPPARATAANDGAGCGFAREEFRDGRNRGAASRPLRATPGPRMLASKPRQEAAMIRIGIIGLGWWGKQIVTCLKDSPRFAVAAGCDVDHNMAAPFAREHGFELVTDYRDLIKRGDIDAVAVVTPHQLHEEMAVAALNAGKHVFCEKPLALTAASAERILEASAKRGGVLGIGH